MGLAHDVVNPWRWIQFLLPTLCLAYSWSGDRLPNPMTREEVFGNDSLYLQFQLKPVLRSPAGIRSQLFDGFLASNEGERPIRGYRTYESGNWKYYFSHQNLRFQGEATSVPGKCEPLLQVQVFDGSRLVRTEKLKGAFCSSGN